jgi:hypothetical protein
MAVSKFRRQTGDRMAAMATSGVEEGVLMSSLFA